MLGANKDTGIRRDNLTYQTLDCQSVVEFENPHSAISEN